jgi:3-mercaptopyruvate sulfurtransferase SseA
LFARVQEYKEGNILSEQEKMMVRHKQEFERIVKEYGLDKGDKVVLMSMSHRHWPR